MMDLFFILQGHQMFPPSTQGNKMLSYFVVLTLASMGQQVVSYIPPDVIRSRNQEALLKGLSHHLKKNRHFCRTSRALYSFQPLVTALASDILPSSGRNVGFCTPIQNRTLAAKHYSACPFCGLICEIT